MKKRIKVVLIVFMGFFLLSFVSAENSAKEMGDNVRSVIQNLAGTIFPNIDTSNPTTLFSYFFLGLILFLLFYSVFEKMDFFKGGKKFLNLVLSAAIVIIIFTSLSKELLSAMLIPYGVLGISLLLILPPFVIIFFSVKLKSPVLAKILLGLFSVYYLFFFFYNYPAKNEVDYLYLLWGIIGVFMVFFIGYIRKQFSNDFVEDIIEKIGLRSDIKVAEIRAERL